MGSQTTAVLVAFAAFHVGLILCIISISSADWLVGNLHANVSTTDNSTYANTSSKGLWDYCLGDGCKPLNQSAQTGDYRAVQVVFTTGTIGEGVAVIMLYIFLFGKKFQLSSAFATGIATDGFLSFACLLVAVILFGVKGLDGNSELDEWYKMQLGWSYFIACAAAVAAFCGFIGSMALMKTMRSKRIAYENI